MRRGEGKAGGIGNPVGPVNHATSVEADAPHKAKSVGPTTQSRWSQRPAQPVLQNYVKSMVDDKRASEAGGLQARQQLSDSQNATKQELLDRQIKIYNSETIRVNAMKEQYENMMKVLKAQERELDVQRKKDKESIEKLREEEMLKIRKEKKVLEQRAKNLQFSQPRPSSQQHQNEVANLRRQLKDQSFQIQNLNQNISNLSQENFELRQELQNAYIELKELGENYHQSLQQISQHEEETQRSKNEELRRDSKIGKGLYQKSSVLNRPPT